MVASLIDVDSYAAQGQGMLDLDGLAQGLPCSPTLDQANFTAMPN